MALFDLHVMVDWSASSVPTRGRDSIWISSRVTASDVDDDPGRTTGLANLATRDEALAHLDELVSARTGARILIGVDFSLGYPSGTARRLTPDQPDWNGMWSLLAELVEDRADNHNNRFEVAAELNRRFACHEGPFWGRPRGREVPGVRATRPVVMTIDEHRRVEIALRAAGRRPFSVWQLCYPGSVGGQTLTGLPVLQRLRRSHPGRVRVWPFETGLAIDPEACDDVVVAEIWPSAFHVDAARHPVRDAAQVLHVTAATVAADRAGTLGEWFAPAVHEPTSVVCEEGWILGIDHDGRPVWPR